MMNLNSLQVILKEWLLIKSGNVDIGKTNQAVNITCFW